MSSELMQLKAYKKLYEIESAFTRQVIERIRNGLDHQTPERLIDASKKIIDQNGQWDRCGLMSSQDQKIKETLLYLLDDSQDLK